MAALLWFVGWVLVFGFVFYTGNSVSFPGSQCVRLGGSPGVHSNFIAELLWMQDSQQASVGCGQ